MKHFDLSDYLETFKDCEAESQTRQKQLRKDFHGVSHVLADALDACRSNHYLCCSLACPVCNQGPRIDSIWNTIAIVEDSPSDFRFVTLVYYKDAMTDRELYKWQLNKFRTKVYQQLKRAGFDGIAMGAIEFDFHEDTQLWIPHLHLIMSNDQKAFGELRKTLKKPKNMRLRDEVISRPMLVAKLGDPVRQACYTFKYMPMRIASFEGSDGKRKTKKYRLRDPQAALAYVKLDQLKPSDLVFKFGTRKTG